MQLLKHMSISAVLLGGFAIIGSGLVAWIHQQTAPTIVANEQATLLRNLHSLVPPDSHDNDLTRDTIQVRNEALLGTPEPVTVYRARQNGEPVTAILNVIAPDGYSGRINLLVAIRYNGELAGVRVINHRETPDWATPSMPTVPTGSTALPVNRSITPARPAGGSKKTGVNSISLPVRP